MLGSRLGLQLFQYLLRPGRHRLGQPRQPGHVDTVGLIRTACNDAAQEGHLGAPFLHRNAIVLDPVILQIRELMMGQYFRKRLVRDGLIAENEQPKEGEIRFYANSLQRTIATAQYFSSGMLPIANVPIEHHALFLHKACVFPAIVPLDTFFLYHGPAGIIQIIFLALHCAPGVIRQLVPKLTGYHTALAADAFCQIH